MAERRRPTETSNFGVGRRESHDASGFYARFAPPVLADPREVPVRPVVTNRLIVGNSENMSEVTDKSVALVVTSPPYFAGKAYEEALGEGHIPATYFDYLGMLEAVFAECMRKLEPGGRIAVNVANLGRKPYRSLSADIIRILQDELGLLLRGEIVWRKAEAAGGSCAWGSFQSPANPVFRDLTERIVVASKGRFDRAIPRRERQKHQPPLPSEPSLRKDDFFEMTTDVWDFPPESATRVGHPAPFPIELPRRLIDLYTYEGDLVLDPFLGSGTTAVAAVKSHRLYIGYDTDEEYVEAARARVAAEEELVRSDTAAPVEVPAVDSAGGPVRVVVPDIAPVDVDDFQARATQEGRSAREIGKHILEECGFVITKEKYRSPVGVEVNFKAEDAAGDVWYFDVSGAFTTFRPGLRRTDTLWKALGKAAALISETENGGPRLVLLTTNLPVKGSAGYRALKNVQGAVYFDAVEMFSVEGQRRLHLYAKGGFNGPADPLMEPDPDSGSHVG